LSKINDIVNLINATLEASTLTNKRFQKGELLGLAELVTKDDTTGKTTVPLILDNDGEGTEVMLNDTLPFQAYHRITEISVATNDDDSYGDGDTHTEETKMKMIIFSNRRIMQFQQDDIITAINVGFPVSLSKTQLATLGNWFSQVDFEVENIDIDKEAVWSGEFGFSNSLPPFYYTFSVNYKIQSHIMAGCYDICEEN